MSIEAKIRSGKYKNEMYAHNAVKRAKLKPNEKTRLHELIDTISDADVPPIEPLKEPKPNGQGPTHVTNPSGLDRIAHLVILQALKYRLPVDTILADVEKRITKMIDEG